MPKKTLDGLIAVTQESLEIERLEAKKDLEKLRVKQYAQIEEICMKVIKYAIWPIVFIFSFFYLREVN